MFPVVLDIYFVLQVGPTFLSPEMGGLGWAVSHKNLDLARPDTLEPIFSAIEAFDC